MASSIQLFVSCIMPGMIMSSLVLSHDSGILDVPTRHAVGASVNFGHISSFCLACD